MGRWDYTNVGVSAKPEDIKYVKKLFQYIGYAPEPEYSPDGDECSFSKPDVYCCKHSAYERHSGKIKQPFREMGHEDMLYLLNALFPGTILYVHCAKGNNTSDTWENHDQVYDTDNMTCYFDDSYTSYGGDGPNGKKSWKARFSLKPPKTGFLNALIEISTAEKNGELMALLLELSGKLRDGLIAYSEDPEDKRRIGEAYDVEEDFRSDEDEDEDDIEF